ncbi:GNAT family N-acetyltransferase [Cellulomonas denverensis]|uniref:GNAT family N-acetyltransferase n=1 Tax=Cellulomonas denverensis TaxID=264297 RepID=A0A7X6QYA3_9CELL|nr:GNAT family N-acetyltransferase [Cellulomonas denverensis]NKY21924.1 GNAT family N-acetyltransferase [Cellulomonas denverensis]GIG24186.1 hypothetical protein Cde04nite_04300 [Cellulomonas denverensis]
MLTVTAPSRAADLDAAADLLAEGFAADPLIGAVLPGDPDRRRARLARFYRVWLHAPEDGRVIDLARRADGEIVGVAVWHAPGAPEHRASPRLAWRVWRALGSAGSRAWARMERAFAAARPADPHWYLSDVVVSGRARGEGVGSALLGHRLAAADQAGAAAYLEATSPGSRRLYERLGFTARGPIGGLPGDGVPPESMWRDPAGLTRR